MLALMPRLGEIQRDGTPDIEFAAVGLLARSQLAPATPRMPAGRWKACGSASRKAAKADFCPISMPCCAALTCGLAIPMP